MVSIAEFERNVEVPLPANVRPMSVPTMSPPFRLPILSEARTMVITPVVWSNDPLSGGPIKFGMAVFAGTDSIVVTVPYSNDGTPLLSVLIPV